MDNGITLVSREMILADVFQTDFKNKTYTIFRFVDLDSLNIYTGSNLDFDYQIGQTYECKLSLKGKKIVVISAEQRFILIA